jgi:outer membrane protein OmpA-like peptidoglycan-associated protein
MQSKENTMHKFISAGVAAIVLSASASAQITRGTVEFGGFGSRTTYASGLGMNAAWGGGGRVGAFITPSFAIEFEGGASHATRNLGLLPVNSSILAIRGTITPITVGRLSLMLGGGIDHTDTYFIESYGAHGLVGGRFRLTDNLGLRVSGILSRMANGNYNNKSLHFGLATFRAPNRLVTTSYINRLVVGPSVGQRPDSVSAWETARLRAAAKQYQALRDSLRLDPVVIVPMSSEEALATMNQVIQFPIDGFALSDSAKRILDRKVTVFNANPDMRIIITGFASAPGTGEYNMALGLKRATAAREYLISRGVAPIRVEISTRGEGQLLVEGPSDFANAANRRTQFRLLVADPYLDAPRRP